MKTNKINILVILIAIISFASCEKEETNLEPLSVEAEIAEFENFIKESGSDEGDGGNSGEQVSNCTIDGLFDRVTRIGHFVGVNGSVSQYGADASATWTINGTVFIPRRPTFININNHISQPGTIEVCFTVVSTDCGTVEKCSPIDFQG